MSSITSQSFKAVEVILVLLAKNNRRNILKRPIWMGKWVDLYVMPSWGRCKWLFAVTRLTAHFIYSIMWLWWVICKCRKRVWSLDAECHHWHLSHHHPHTSIIKNLNYLSAIIQFLLVFYGYTFPLIIHQTSSSVLQITPPCEDF